jgi:PAS domain S-box-containing protein
MDTAHAMANRTEMVRRQRALADFGEFVLSHESLTEILQEGCRLVADALGADLAKVIEIEHGRDTGLVRAGVGWKSGVVGHARVELSERTSEAHALNHGEPVITQDIAEERRFVFPEFMRDHGVVAIVNVPIFLPGRKPYGLLQVDAREPRTFDEEDIAFLQTYAMILGPVIDRLQAVGALMEADERFRLFVNNARGYVIVLTDPEGSITDWLGGSAEVFGWSADDIVGHSVATLYTPEDRAGHVPESELERARTGGSAPDVRWHQRKDGSRVFLDGQTIALLAGGGGVRGFVKIAQDVTARRRAEERQAVLTAELQHRVRNVLAMVRSIARRTFQDEETFQEAAAHFDGRLSALARTQTVLTRATGDGADLETLIWEELHAQAADPDAIEVSGPRVRIAPKAAEIVTLAIHELATNANKYGAFAQEGGRLVVTWTQRLEAGDLWLHLDWQESGLKVATTAPRRQGFGTELIARRVPYELRGQASIDLRPGGLHCSLDFPLVHAESTLATGGPP